MTPSPNYVLDSDELSRFLALQSAAVASISARFQIEKPALYASDGERAQQSCVEDVQFTLDFLRPVVEFGFLQPFVEYLRWQHAVMTSRGTPPDEVATSLDWIGAFFAEHMPGPGGTKINSALRLARLGFQAAGISQPEAEIDKKMPQAWPECEAFKDALLQGNLRQATALFDARLVNGASFLDAELHLIQPALYQIGRDWQDNKVSVAQEHLATATAVTLMAQTFPFAAVGKSNGKKVILACVEDNEHEVGLRMVADTFEMAGWDVRFLGGNTPTRELVEMVKVWTPHLVGLSVSFPHQLKAVRAVISQMRAELALACPAILVGGLAFNSFASSAPMMTADDYAPDAGAALIQANKLVGLTL